MMIVNSADTDGELSVPTAEDLPHGFDRVRFCTGCL